MVRYKSVKQKRILREIIDYSWLLLELEYDFLMNSLYLSCIRSETVTMKILFCVIHYIFLYNGTVRKKDNTLLCRKFTKIWKYKIAKYLVRKSKIMWMIDKLLIVIRQSKETLEQGKIYNCKINILGDLQLETLDILIKMQC